ncbi:MAG: hypothetical protein ACI3V3_08505 [Faecousia sp.]
MPAEGYLQVHAYSSDALIPLEGVAIAVLDDQGTLLSAQLTDKSGRIKPVKVQAPDLADSLTPDFVGRPFSTVTIRAQHPLYEQIQVEQVQLFAGVTTMQPLEMIPIALYPDKLDRIEYFKVPPQNL